MQIAGTYPDLTSKEQFIRDKGIARSKGPRGQGTANGRGVIFQGTFKPCFT